MPSARVQLTMHGQGISLGELGRALYQFQRFTNAVAEERHVNAATWRVEDLRIGSAVAIAALDIPSDGQAFASDLITGVNSINAEPRVPDEFGVRSLPSLGGMGQAAQHHPIEVGLIGSQLATVIDLTTARNVRKASRATSESIGGFYGTVQLLDSRRGLKFGIRDEFRRRWIPCVADDDSILSDATAAFQNNVRVYVSGRIVENAAHQPLRVRVTKLELQPWANKSVDEFVGAAKDYYDEHHPGMTSAEIVRADRDNNW